MFPVSFLFISLSSGLLAESFFDSSPCLYSHFPQFGIPQSLRSLVPGSLLFRFVKISRLLGHDASSFLFPPLCSPIHRLPGPEGPRGPRSRCLEDGCGVEDVRTRGVGTAATPIWESGSVLARQERLTSVGVQMQHI